MKKYEDMTDAEKTKYFATGRCTAGEINQLLNGDFVRSYLPRVRGHYVRLSAKKKKKYKTPEEAIKAAVKFREVMRERVIALGL